MQNVLNTLKPVSGVSHPLIATMYLKKDFSSAQEDVLVIHTRHRDIDIAPEHAPDATDFYIMDLLMDLEDLKSQVEKKAGRFDRVDIRTT